MRKIHLSLTLATLATALLTGCGGGDPLAKDEVVGIPAGDATGTAATGTYAAQMQIVACTGTCTPWVCTVGQDDEAQAEVVLVNGRLTWDAGGVPLAGGIDADGGFDIGGWGTLPGLEATIRSEGTWDGARVSGTYDMHVVGSHDDQPVDCVGEALLSATRVR